MLPAGNNDVYMNDDDLKEEKSMISDLGKVQKCVN